MPLKRAKIIFARGPAALIQSIFFLGFFNLFGFTGTGLAHPKCTKKIIIVPNRSRCASGFKVTLFHTCFDSLHRAIRQSEYLWKHWLHVFQKRSQLSTRRKNGVSHIIKQRTKKRKQYLNFGFRDEIHNFVGLCSGYEPEIAEISYCVTTPNKFSVLPDFTIRHATSNFGQV